MSNPELIFAIGTLCALFLWLGVFYKYILKGYYPDDK